MTKTWDAVDEYVAGLLVPSETGFDAAALPAIAVSPAQGQWLFLMALALRAQRILEIGTLGGYSTICLARSGARVITLEVSPEHANVARANIERAGYGHHVEIRVGPAIETLADLQGPF